MRLSEIVSVLVKVSEDFNGEDVELQSLIMKDGQVYLEVLSDQKPESIENGEVLVNDKTGVLN